MTIQTLEDVLNVVNEHPADGMSVRDMVHALNMTYSLAGTTLRELWESSKVRRERENQRTPYIYYPAKKRQETDVYETMKAKAAEAPLPPPIYETAEEKEKEPEKDEALEVNELIDRLEAILCGTITVAYTIGNRVVTIHKLPGK